MRSGSSQWKLRRSSATSEYGVPGEDNTRPRAAKAVLEPAKLNFEFTEVWAPVDAYVTNLNLRVGSQAVVE